ncbi:virulence protein SrfB [Caenispirillum salinarum AK4]|uniref:Virulence protein SrfB n=1 Tax=Caenispirillum salinarum AK4 TaxID=1238182 RepID=K9H5A4_9PROT|nr:virulence factor SrfB [Caenispirillum salinarum]EKV32259.1 virulence protein SrfB [Caenispirillum salinarum AK4]
MLKKLTDFPDVITLVPNSGIQMLDFGLKLSDLSKLSRSFWPEKRDEKDPDGGTVIHLHPLREDDDSHVYVNEEYPDGRVAPAEEVNSYRAGPALAILDSEWLPVPVLRSRTTTKQNADAYDRGPIGWARLRTAALDEPDEHGNTHRVTIAFDTTLGAPKRENAPYLAPEPRDAQDPVEFQLVSDPEAIMFFLEARPIRRWLKDRFLACMARHRGRPVPEEDIDPGEYWAQYVMLIEAVNAACKVPRIKLIDTVSSPASLRPIEVDLVIDVGNSRTCGILIEKARDEEQLDISGATRLELRDLTRPHLAYSDPFETWVEFSPARFGSYAHARRTSQQNAFWWPSLVRIGPEASWLAARSDGTEGITGLSSPKRYLWDKEARQQPWSNTRGLTPPGEDPEEIKGPMTAELTEDGQLLGGAGRTVGTSPRYSRASLYTLMLVELLSHALVQINSPGLRSQRANRDIPRRLNNLILTLPSATPLAEQKALKRFASDAWELLARIMRWGENDPLHKAPTIRMDWDEATCTHLVYLHNEINWKYQGQPRELFDLLGGGRKGPDGGPALRIASIDIGGGTTDLMIIEHEVEGKSIVHPRQLFREGFRLAGDDIVKTVVEQLVLPRFVEHLAECGLSPAAAHGLITDLFGGDREGTAEQDRTLRVNFVKQVLTPAALGLLGAYEAVDGRRTAGEETFKVGELLAAGHPPQAHVRAYLEREAERRGAADFRIEDVTLTMAPRRMAAQVTAVIGGMLDDLCDVVRHYQCDLLLLSGRPSRLPVVRDRINTSLPVPPNRVVAMHKYEVFNWYPFRSNDFRIRDPKTTAAVGAMLCLMCEGRMPGFFMKSSEIKMKSTARYLGVMNQRGEITDDNVLIHNVDFDTGDGVVGFELKMEGPTFIGFRQLPLARWKTTPLYYLTFRDHDRLAKLRLPIRVEMERQVLEEGADEAGLEDFKVVDAEDADRKTCRNGIKFRLQTLRNEAQGDSGYWLDSGVLRIAPTAGK